MLGLQHKKRLESKDDVGYESDQDGSSVLPEEEDDEEKRSVLHSVHSDPTSSHQYQHSSNGPTLIEQEQSREEKRVCKRRLVVFLAILICGVIVAIAVYRFAKEASDVRSFEQEYNDLAQDMIDLVVWEVQYNFALMQQLSASVTSVALAANATFPNVTVPHYEIKGGYVDGLGGIMVAGYAPLVPREQQTAWEEYAQQHQDWLAESAALKISHPGHRRPMLGTIQDHEGDRRSLTTTSEEVIASEIWRWENGQKVPQVSPALQGGPELYAPLWQLAPASAPTVNVNLLSDDRFVKTYQDVLRTRQTVLSEFTEIYDMFDFAFDDHEKHRKKNPHAFIVEPVYASFEMEPEMVGLLVALTSWENLINQLVPEDKNGIVVVFSDTCGHSITYQVNGALSTFQGEGDRHDSAFDKYHRYSEIELYRTIDDEICVHTLNIYPSSTYQDSFSTNSPLIFTLWVVGAFLFTGCFLMGYDIMFTHRQKKTMSDLMVKDQFISSLFPETVKNRLIPSSATGEGGGTDNKASGIPSDSLAGPSGQIADFFPDASIAFMDLAGFTAWSSTRAPLQVFTLLETVFGAVDEIARKRGIFKVETVGDCYVAACGLPTPRQDHAVAMVRFARDAIRKVAEWTQTLEESLGPDTSDLAFRVGIHSGAVTGGVLRGQNSRFQLFGDTMNTAARIETSGEPGKIHVSQETAALLTRVGRDQWLIPREGVVAAKGKGNLKTYWVVVKDRASSSDGGQTTASLTSVDDLGSSAHEAIAECFVGAAPSEKTARLIKWNVDLLARFLKQIVARRRCMTTTTTPHSPIPPIETSMPRLDHLASEEVADVILFPQYQFSSSAEEDPVVLSDTVFDQLTSYVSHIAAMHLDQNDFHNFEHASHVTLSISQCFSRHQTLTEDVDPSDASYGDLLASDPWTPFACVFSALIHDVHHPSVSNAQLIREQAPLCQFYQNRSMAEQNSLDLAWTLWMDPDYTELRNAVHGGNDWEWKHFRQLVVNLVLATDVDDPKLQQLRHHRWEQAFAACEEVGSDPKLVHRQATIVLEYLMQASDMSHTMQHWDVYCKWNELRFLEGGRAYQAGRASSDPNDWYERELESWETCTLPLVKRLKDSGIWGVSSEEYYHYAVQNRDEWKVRGREIVAKMAAKLEQPKSRH